MEKWKSIGYYKNIQYRIRNYSALKPSVQRKYELVYCKELLLYRAQAQGWPNRQSFL